MESKLGTLFCHEVHENFALGANNPLRLLQFRGSSRNDFERIISG
jgi:hypothetical protein